MRVFFQFLEKKSGREGWNGSVRKVVNKHIPTVWTEGAFPGRKAFKERCRPLRLLNGSMSKGRSF